MLIFNSLHILNVWIIIPHTNNAIVKDSRIVMRSGIPNNDVQKFQVWTDSSLKIA